MTHDTVEDHTVEEEESLVANLTSRLNKFMSWDGWTFLAVLTGVIVAVLLFVIQNQQDATRAAIQEQIRIANLAFADEMTVADTDVREWRFEISIVNQGQAIAQEFDLEIELYDDLDGELSAVEATLGEVELNGSTISIMGIPEMRLRVVLVVSVDVSVSTECGQDLSGVTLVKSASTDHPDVRVSTSLGRDGDLPEDCRRADE